MIRLARALLCTVALTTLASPAFAQEQDAGAAATASPSDIVVTAQRREERAQDVPVVVTAFSAARLEELNVTEPQGLYGTVPSLVVGNQGQASRDVQSYAIRGQSTGFLASPAVAVYVAEVPVPSSISLNLQGSAGDYIDLENIQVLSGPQGTLFGRNTTGGAVLLSPRRPTNKFEGYVEGTIGNYDLRGFEGAINIPLIDDQLMVRVAANYQDRRGFTRDVVWNKWRDDIHRYAGRVSVLFKPTERLSNYLIAYGSRSSTNGAGHIHRAFNIPALQAIGFCSDTAPVPGLGVSCDVYRRQTELANELGPRATRHDIDDFSKIRSWGLINTTDYEINDNLTLRNIASYQNLKDNYSADQDGTPIQQYSLVQNSRLPQGPIPGLAEFGLPLGGAYTNGDATFNSPRDHLKQITEELQLQGKALGNHLNFVVGGFYLDAKPASTWGSTALNYCPALFTGLCAPSFSATGVGNKSKALYAQGTLDLGALLPSLEKLRITAGYRYTWDTIKGFAYGYVFTAPEPGNVTCNSDGRSVPFASAPTECLVTDTLKSKAPTWTLGVDYKPMRDVLVYAKVTRGYKSGGFNTFSVRPETRTFAPEKLTTYEAGFKSDWRIGSVPFRLNGTYYYSDYKNIQRPAGDFNNVTGANGALVLPATATIQGFEVETSIRPIQGVEFGANVSHTDAEYKRFTQVVLAPSGAPACNGSVPQGGVADYSCNRFQFVTPWIVNANASFDLPLRNDLGNLTLFVNYSHVSSQNTSPLVPASIEPGVLISGYGTLGGSLGWRNIAGSGVDASLFATNITNKRFRVSNSGVFQSLLVWSELYGEPRMFGLKLRYSMGQ